MKLNNNQQGFTLIEMMVVIAVIGILSAAVLAGLGPSRAKARDARVISGLNQIRTIAETVYNPTSATPYSTLDAAAASVKADIATQGTTATITINAATPFQFAASAPLPSNKAKIYCVSSGGYSGLGGPDLSGGGPSADDPCAGGLPGAGATQSDNAVIPTGSVVGAACVVPAPGGANPCVSTATCVEGLVTGVGTCQQ